MATREGGRKSQVARPIEVADCVRLPDGRIGRVRGVGAEGVRVRVRRRTSKAHQFLVVRATRLRRVDCPKGWMTPPGYARYLRITLVKLRKRLQRGKNRGRTTPANPRRG